MGKKTAYKIVHLIGLAGAVGLIPLLGIYLKTLFAQDSMDPRSLAVAAFMALAITALLALSGGVFDSVFARIVGGDPGGTVPLAAFFSPKKETLYNVFIRWGGFLALIGLFTFDWISYDMNLVSTQIIGLPDLYILLLSAFMLVALRKILQPEVLLFLLISVCFLVYSKTQGIGLMATLQGYKDFFTVIWLFFLFKYLPFKNETIVQGARVITAFALLQLPVQVAQYILTRDVESCSGTFGFHATGVLGIFMAGAVLYIVSVKKLDRKHIALILYFCLSPLLGSARFFFVFNFFLVPLILIKRFRIRISGRVIFALVLLCLAFVGLLQLNQLWYEGGNIAGMNPFYFLSGDYLRDLVAVTSSTLPRGGAVVWALNRLQDEGQLLLGRGVGWRRNLSPLDYQAFKRMRIAMDVPMVLLLTGVLGLLVFGYIAWSLFKTRIRFVGAAPEVKFFFLCLAGLYLIAGVYTQGWASKTTGYCFAIVAGLLSNRTNRRFFLERYFRPNHVRT